jgi:CMP-N,N'-diacetyllegionaminic acid synthase
MGLEVLGIIPARGGSKGLPRKNILSLAGKPMIVWTIEAARASTLLDRVIVSTDDREIAAIAETHAAEVPFLRPADLAQDSTPTIDPVLHLLDFLVSVENYRPDYVILLQPTSPLRSTDDIDAAIRIAHARKCSVVSVTEAAAHPLWMKQVDRDGTLRDFLQSDGRYARRQDLPPVYQLNGAIYLTPYETLLEEKSFCPAGACAYIMPAERSLDVDTCWDYQLADLLLQKQNKHERN